MIFRSGRLRGELWASLARLLRTAHAVIREIFDEAAYERFLTRTQVARSRQTYRDFLRDREAGAARRPRCC